VWRIFFLQKQAVGVLLGRALGLALRRVPSQALGKENDFLINRKIVSNYKKNGCL